MRIVRLFVRCCCLFVCFSPVTTNRKRVQEEKDVSPNDADELYFPFSFFFFEINVRVVKRRKKKKGKLEKRYEASNTIK